MRIWVTRAEFGASATAERLRGLGHEPVVAPLLEIQRLQPDLDLEGIGALAFTSVNGVAAFAALTNRRDLPVYAVGDATAEAARGAGFERVLSASGAVDDLIDLIVTDRKATDASVLWASANVTADDLSGGLTAQGVNTRRIVVYDVVEKTLPAAALAAWLAGEFDAVLIHSPRAAHSLAAVLPSPSVATAAVCISDAAAAPLRRLGHLHVAVAARPDETSLLAALGKLRPRV